MSEIANTYSGTREVTCVFHIPADDDDDDAERIRREGWSERISSIFDGVV